MYYCPKCGKFELNFDVAKHKSERTVINIRDCYSRPIIHYMCECGNPLAGNMEIRGLMKDEYDYEAVDYAKSIITAYNEGGDYFEQGLLDKANRIYEERKN
jgi:hypothetical protein